MSQEKGKIRVFTQGSESVIRLDSMRLQNGRFVELDSGVYTVKVWAPTRELVEKEVKIVPKLHKTVRIKLPYTEEYKRYKWQDKKYKTKKYFLRYGAASAYGLFALATLTEMVFLNSDANKYEDAVTAHRDAYNRAFWPHDLEKHKRLYYENKENYQEKVDQLNKKWHYLGMGAFIAGTLTYFGWKCSKKLTKPAYSEQPLLSRIRYSPVIQGQYSGVHLQLQF